MKRGSAPPRPGPPMVSGHMMGCMRADHAAGRSSRYFRCGWVYALTIAELQGTACPGQRRFVGNVRRAGAHAFARRVAPEQTAFPAPGRLRTGEELSVRRLGDDGRFESTGTRVSEEDHGGQAGDCLFTAVRFAVPLLAQSGVSSRELRSRLAGRPVAREGVWGSNADVEALATAAGCRIGVCELRNDGATGERFLWLREEWGREDAPRGLILHAGSHWSSLRPVVGTHNK